MTNRQTSRLLIGLLSLFIVAFLACPPPEPPPDDDVEVVVDTTFHGMWHFYHAYLADCANERYVDGESNALSVLTDTATNRITRAIQDTAMTNTFGTEELVWGPVLAVDKVDSDDSDEYVSENLLYCLRLVDDGGVTYSVGIAGTNAVSSYDWLDEDIAIQDTVAWSAGGGISQASSTGLNKLLGLRDNGVGIDSFLRNAVRTSADPIQVAVAGHSLGGALTQVLSSYLQQELDGVKAGTPVTAWVYAGPTAGTATFANALVNQLTGYFAYNNTRDVVPHAWTTDTLKQLCSIYTNLSICDTAIQSSLLVNGLVRFLIGRSENVPYTAPPGKITYFTGEPLLMSDTTGCGAFYSELSEAWTYSDLGDVYSNLNTLSAQCQGPSTISEEDFYQFAYFLAELGEQHVTAYYDYFLTGSPVYDRLSLYVQGEGGDYIKWDGAIALGNIIAAANSYLSSNNITSCNCD
ncbi:MAG: hypothetical protein AAFP77_12795 [Bacteroidota bacterium]